MSSESSVKLIEDWRDRWLPVEQCPKCGVEE